VNTTPIQARQIGPASNIDRFNRFGKDYLPGLIGVVFHGRCPRAS